MISNSPEQVEIVLTATTGAFVTSEAVVNVIYSPRGEGKTVAGIASLFHHAKRNKKPITCAIVRDTHENIKLSVARSIQKVLPASRYKFKNDYKELILISNPPILVDLFGIADPGALQKLQGSEYALVWLEEPAPMVDKANAGLSEDVFNAALIVCARQTDCSPRLQVSMNPADQDHWTYKRFFEEPNIDPENPLITKAVFEVPYGDNPYLPEISRQATKAAYKHDPASYARYVGGKFAAITQGKKVTPDYGTGNYTSTVPLKPAKGLEGFMSFDGWQDPVPYDKKTEVLTALGWKKINEVNLGELVMTLNPETQEMEYQPVFEKVHRKHTGDMYHWKGKNYDLRVTDYHSIPMLMKKSGKIISKPACEVGFQTMMPKSGLWAGSYVPDFVLPRHDNPPVHINAAKMDTDTYAEFMGIYLSEGSTSRYKAYKTDDKPCHYDTVIYQKERKEEIENLLNKMPFKWTWFENSRGNGWKAHSIQLYKYLKEFGLSYEKFVPEEIKRLPPEQIRKFLHFYIIGDGAEGRTITTSSKIMADDLQELVLKAGGSATIGVIDRRGQVSTTSHGRTIIVKHILYRVYITYRKMTYLRRSNLKIEKVENEDVYCVEAPNHILYVRRNGKPRWCGNCTLGQILPTGRLVFIDTLVGNNIDIRILIDQKVKPMLNSPRWKDMCKSWRYMGDRSMKIPDQSNINESAAKVVENAFKSKTGRHAHFEGGPARWEHMKRGIDKTFAKNIAGKTAFIVNKNNRLLDKALSGSWAYKVDNAGNVVSDIPMKTGSAGDASHVGDAWANAINVLMPTNIITLSDEKLKKMQEKTRTRAKSYAVG